MRIELTRYYHSGVQTRGYLRIKDTDHTIHFEACTLELPWKDNENRVSCIPTGRYTLSHRSPAESGTYNCPHYIVEDVEGRSYILIHPGNLYTDILGCILVGSGFVDINGDGHPDVVDSTDTLAEMRSVTEELFGADAEMDLIVRDAHDLLGPIPEAEPEMIQVEDSLDENIRELQLA